MFKCRVCGYTEEPNLFVEFNNMPKAAQNMPTEKELSEDCGIKLRLCQCNCCGLVQFECDPVWYYKDVIRSGGYSSTMYNLRKSQYSHLIDTYKLKGKRFIEIGCGQGEFLSILNEFPVESYGIENNADLVEIAQKKGLNVWNDFVDNENIRLKGAPYDVFLSFNFIEHQPDPNAMIKGIYNNLTKDGMGIITAPSFEYILEQESYYELIRDHLAYYTEETLTILLNKNGFRVLEMQRINRDTIAAVVKKKEVLLFKPLEDNFINIQNEIDELVKNNKGLKIAMWGASHQGFTLASTTSLCENLEYIIDSAPFKQGKYSPASHVEIISPQEAREKELDIIIIVAPGYTDEIYGIIEDTFKSDISVYVLKTNSLEKYR